MTTTVVGSRTVDGLALPATPPRSGRRLQAVDLVRGVAMVLMAIDHVRVYSGLPPGGPTPGIFFTRWITHFVAPTFVFLAGTGIYLHGVRLPDRAALSRYLLTRGLWLVLLELTVIRVAWTFNVDFAHYLLAGVIWMIGWCMVIMAALVHVPLVVNAVAGVAIIALHNISDLVHASLDGWFWQVLYTGGPIPLGEHGPPLFVLFVIVPWIGVMMAGYAFGAVMQLEAERRRSICLRLGLGVTALFLLLRAIDAYGDPRHWHTALEFLNTTKYPASLLFLAMTLGPMLIGVAMAERARGPVADGLATLGRVPMFYYLLHISLIHVAACIVSVIREGAVDPWLFANHPVNPGPPPDGYTWSLPLLYLVFAIVIAVLYPLCRWYARVKATRRWVWLSYL